MRPVTRRRWPSGRVTHDELRPLKVAWMAAPTSTPGQYVQGRPLVQNTRVGLAARRTHGELVERILRRAGLQRRHEPGYLTGGLQRDRPRLRQGYHALQLGFR